MPTGQGLEAEEVKGRGRCWLPFTLDQHSSQYWGLCAGRGLCGYRLQPPGRGSIWNHDMAEGEMDVGGVSSSRELPELRKQNKKGLTTMVMARRGLPINRHGEQGDEVPTVV